nr:hypothetical protein [Tanacetum cinerariifolium]
MCINYTYGDGKPITCCICKGPLRGGFCLFCNSKTENPFTYDPNAYSFNDTSSNFNHLLQPQYETYLCELCGNNSHYGYDCQQQFPLVYEQELSYNQNYNENPSNEIAVSNSNQEKEKSPQDSDIRQLIRKECCIEVCRKKNQNMEDTMLELVEVCRQKGFYCMHNNVDDLIEKQPTERGDHILESLQNFRVKKSSTSLTNTFQISPLHAITPILPTEELEYSLSMSEYEVTFDYESECEVPVKDESSPVFTTFSSPLFDDNDDFTSSDDESLPDEDVLMEDFKVYSNPLFDDEEISFDEIDPHCLNAESNFVESLSNHDALIDSSSKFDYLEELFGALMPTSIVDEERIRREREEYTSLMEKLFSINSSPRLMENFHANTIVETLPTSPIPVEDSDSQREEIDIFTDMDDLPPSIESDDYDSERDIYVLEELLVDDSISILKNESLNFDHQDDPSFPRPPPEPPDVEFFFDFEPDSGEVILAVMNNIDELNEEECFDPGDEINVFTNVEDDDFFSIIFVIRIFLPYLIYPEVSPLLLSVESEDTIFDTGIFV